MAGHDVPGAWFSFDEAERRDAERVAELEELATAAHPDLVASAEFIGEANALRAKWDKPRRLFDSFDDVIAELRSVVTEAASLELVAENSEALEDLAGRAVRSAHALEEFAGDVSETALDEALDDESEDR